MSAEYWIQPTETESMYIFSPRRQNLDREDQLGDYLWSRNVKISFESSDGMEVIFPKQYECEKELIFKVLKEKLGMPISVDEEAAKIIIDKKYKSNFSLSQWCEVS